jgi:hypothetical protein
MFPEEFDGLAATPKQQQTDLLLRPWYAQRYYREVDYSFKPKKQRQNQYKRFLQLTEGIDWSKYPALLALAHFGEDLILRRNLNIPNTVYLETDPQRWDSGYIYFFQNSTIRNTEVEGALARRIAGKPMVGDIFESTEKTFDFMPNSIARNAAEVILLEHFMPVECAAFRGKLLKSGYSGYGCAPVVDPASPYVTRSLEELANLPFDSEKPFYSALHLYKRLRMRLPGTQHLGYVLDLLYYPSTFGNTENCLPCKLTVWMREKLKYTPRKKLAKSEPQRINA